MTYHLYKGAILRNTVHHGHGSLAVQVGVRLCAFNELRRAERVGGGSLFARHEESGGCEGEVVGGYGEIADAA